MLTWPSVFAEENMQSTCLLCQTRATSTRRSRKVQTKLVSALMFRIGALQQSEALKPIQVPPDEYLGDTKELTEYRELQHFDCARILR